MLRSASSAYVPSSHCGTARSFATLKMTLRFDLSERRPLRSFTTLKITLNIIMLTRNRWRAI